MDALFGKNVISYGGSPIGGFGYHGTPYRRKWFLWYWRRRGFIISDWLWWAKNSIFYKTQHCIYWGIVGITSMSFPNFWKLPEQFSTFIKVQITNGGALVYNAKMPSAKIVEIHNTPSRKCRTATPQYDVVDGVTLGKPQGKGSMPIAVLKLTFSIWKERWICQLMGWMPMPSMRRFPVFKGEQTPRKIAERFDAIAYKDFAHSPSKVKATAEAVKINTPTVGY